MSVIWICQHSRGGEIILKVGLYPQKKKTTSYAAGENIISEGETIANMFYIVFEGQVSVLRKCRSRMRKCRSLLQKARTSCS